MALGLEKVVDDLPWRRLHEHPDIKRQIAGAAEIAAMDLTKVEASKGDTTKNVVRGLMHMVSGKSGSTEAERLKAQAAGARALAWLCYLDDVPKIFLEGAEQGGSAMLATLSRVLKETHDRTVMAELIGLVGWLANSSDDNAQLVGDSPELLRSLADQLAARAPALQRKAAWALACLARGKNKMRILSGDIISAFALVVKVRLHFCRHACVLHAWRLVRVKSVDALSMQVRVQVTTMNG